MAFIFPSLISSDLLSLKTTITALNPYCSGYHIDVMDNHFVPSLTWGSPFINAIAHATTHPLWIHLMVDNPLSFINQLHHLPANSIISFHYESIKNLKEIEKIITCIQQKKLRASIAINPETPINTIASLLPRIDHVLLMSVHPGASGQLLLPGTINKLTALHTYLTSHQLQDKVTIALDGGITHKNIDSLAAHGAHHFAVASALFDTPDPVAALHALQNKLVSYKN